MGWFSNAFVFAQEPRWKALARSGVRCAGIWGYKHHTRDIWLAALPATTDEKLSPFAMDVPTDFRTDGAVAPHALDRFDKVARALITEYLDLCVGYVHLTLAVAQRAGVPTFFFAADDEFRDVGCRANPNGLEQFAGKFPDFLVRYGDRRMTVLVPHVEGLQSFPATRLERCRRLKDVTVIAHDSPPPPLPSAPPRSRRRIRATSSAGADDLARWGTFYRFPVELWPTAAGAPGEILGLGTWDVWDRFDDNFEVVFRGPGKPPKR